MNPYVNVCTVVVKIILKQKFDSPENNLNIFNTNFVLK